VPNLYGKSWDRASLLRRIGSIRQIGGAQPVVLDDGPERGVRAIEVRTGTGFCFTVLPDRGMDVWRAEFRGASLCWHSPTGPIAPAYFEPAGLGWLRGFAGGMLVTCGLTYLGAPTRDEGKDLGLHGRASYTPAAQVGIHEDWKGDEYHIVIHGQVREAAVFGENVVLSRKIRTSLGENAFRLEDEVENAGHEPVPHTILYHVNAGFPLVDEGAELLTPRGKVTPLDAEAAREPDGWARFEPPAAGTKERCYAHAFGGERAAVALVNRARGLGYALRWKTAQLPCFTEWKMTGAGIYVVGTEPGNVVPAPRDKMRAEGRLPLLAPGERRRTELEFAVLASADEIRAAEDEIRRA
jgi:hypothetical protein